MELLSIWRVLSRHRIAVALGAVVAIVAALAAAGMLPVGPASAKPTRSGLARAQVMIDLPHSLVDDLGSQSNTIGAQADMLADLVASHGEVVAVAAAAGVPRADLSVLRPSLTLPVKVSPLATRAGFYSTVASPYALTISPSTLLPIITIEAAAPSRAQAAKLVSAASEELVALENRRAPTPDRRLLVRTIDPVRSITVVTTASSRAPLAVVVLIGLFTLWLMGIVLASGLARALRYAPELDPA